ncbi:hypothetical protein EP47_08310 [Legionella norrlandica]|uniref:Uncharacterized protein n=1 Tax=Legionella norrlandica TaxID=1498499 RepID=A0A0A2T4T7_9GAMM|nr:hypothetical protein [Legionella norrlandica]KGP62408.1 hypothetical protein EP47_08310 [Legionella norrlandica]
MTNFTYLDNILEMDFSQMRRKPVLEGMTATDEAISYFIDNFNSFFAQFKKRPSEKDLATYRVYLEKILLQINKSEYEYFLSCYSTQYSDLSEKEIQNMAHSNCLRSIKDIPTRIQYWARAKTWGDSIRNPQEHKKAIDSLNQWSKWIYANTGVFFQCPAQGDIEKDSNQNPDQLPKINW